MSSKIRRLEKKHQSKTPVVQRLESPRYNRWSCDCGYSILTVEHVDGVTPFMVPCGRCGGMAKSHSYKVTVGPNEKPDGEWRMPTADEYRKLNAGCRDHCDRGGLNYYPTNHAQPSEN